MRTSDKFLILAKPAQAATGQLSHTYRVKLHELKLYYRKININSQLKVDIDRALSKGQYARYPINKTVLRFGQAVKGIQDFTFTPIHSGRLPYFCVGFIISEDAMMGDYAKNPLNAEVHQLESWTFCVNNVNLPISGYVINDPKSMEYLREYGVFLDQSAAGRFNNSNMISHERWNDHYRFYVLDLTPDSCSG